MLATLIHDQAAWVKWLVFLLAVGLLVTLSPITPFTTEDGIPITLQSLLVVFLPILLGWRVGVAAVVAYLIIGGLGAPVFSYGTYGWDRFTGSSGGFLLAFPIAGLLAGYAMEQFQNTKSVLIGALLLFAGQFIILGLGLFWYRAIIPVEESMLASVERLLPGLFIKTAFGGLALVLIQRLVAAALKSRNVETP
ncbi:MAG: biotin transporter BioY [Bacteroidota bacterium]|nr:biotin transporter BioY [Bacteroidota bacterium]MEE3163279.1 biotin transporter BioY [Bacteroidota bacterium]